MKIRSRLDGGTRNQVARARRGNATVVAVIALLAIGSLAGLILSTSYRSSLETGARVNENRAYFVAKAGANQALAELAGGGTGALGTADAPIAFSGGAYWVSSVDSGDSTVTLTSHGRIGLQAQSVEVVVRTIQGGVYENGIFAGNCSQDPLYNLPLSGTGTQADEVHGDIYSGGNVTISGNATVDGTVRANGNVQGSGTDPNELGTMQPIPDLAGMNYATTADVKVNDLFAAAAYKSASAGGSAWQLPESSPAHIFRKNPSDRTTNTSSTVKDDYFLEDPYETVRSDSKSDGSDPYKITLSGVSGKPGSSSNQKVFYIDGNLWIHNYKTMSFQIGHSDPNGVQVTFIVKGNIYFSDNLFYKDKGKDGVAFIAMKDSAVKDSGNVYFGDPSFGTLEHMDAFMYAENNFYDYNLNATGSTSIELDGNMTAGNQVLINRDYTTVVNTKTVKMHNKLKVVFDGRIQDGSLDMPGLPKSTPVEGDAFEVLSWRGATPE